MKDCDILLREIGAWKLVQDEINAGEKDLVLVADDRVALDLLCEALALSCPKLGLACALLDFAKSALSPFVLVSSIERVTRAAFEKSRPLPVGPPSWLTPHAAEQEHSQDADSIVPSLGQILDEFASRAAELGLRPVLLTKDFSSLKALNSYSGIDDAFAMFGSVLASFPDLRLAIFECGLSGEAAWGNAEKCVSRVPSEVVELPNLTPGEISSIASQIVRAPLPEATTQVLSSLSDGRLSYLMSLCAECVSGRDEFPTSEAELVATMAKSLLEPLSALSLLLGAKMRESLVNVRGDTVLKHIMRLLSFEEGTTATKIAEAIQRSVPATYDYLRWLTRCLVLRKSGSRYSFRDRLVRLWIRLDTLAEAGGPGLTLAVVEKAIREVLISAEPSDRPGPVVVEMKPTAPKPSSEGESEAVETALEFEAPRPRDESLLEFD